MSTLCLGSMNFGSSTDKAEAIRIVHCALDSGINFVDTANIYNRGVSESILGEALAEHNKRQRVILATKVHVSMDDSDPNASGNHRRHIIEQCHASLKRLNTDVIDIYYIHRPSTQVPIDETLRALDDLIRAGKVRYIGTSSFASWQILEALWVAKEYGLNRFVVEQAPYHLLDRRIERELLPMAQTYGIGITLWSPLAGGFLTGKYKRGEARPGDSRFTTDGDAEGDWSRRHFVDAAFDVGAVLQHIADERACLPVQMALAWGLAHPAVTSTVLGTRTMQQLEEQLPAATLTLSQDEQQQLDAASTPGRVITPYYLDDSFADFRPHQYRW